MRTSARTLEEQGRLGRTQAAFMAGSRRRRARRRSVVRSLRAVFSVVVNDLADAAIDRVNLPADPSRPLVSGAGTRHDLVGVAAGAALAAVAVAGWIGPQALVVVVAGLLVSSAYSWQLSRRGAVASLVLPALFVAVPFLVGLFEVRTDVRRADLVLLAGLYLGFVGRILLKDFRDLAGDTLYGKRTFLVRHGRRATCLFAAVGWTLGPLCSPTVPWSGDPPGDATPSTAGRPAGLALSGSCAVGRLRSGLDRFDEVPDALAGAVVVGAEGEVLDDEGEQQRPDLSRPRPACGRRARGRARPATPASASSMASTSSVAARRAVGVAAEALAEQQPPHDLLLLDRPPQPPHEPFEALRRAGAAARSPRAAGAPRPGGAGSRARRARPAAATPSTGSGGRAWRR